MPTIKEIVNEEVEKFGWMTFPQLSDPDDDRFYIVQDRGPHHSCMDRGLAIYDPAYGKPGLHWEVYNLAAEGRPSGAKLAGERGLPLYYAHWEEAVIVFLSMESSFYPRIHSMVLVEQLKEQLKRKQQGENQHEEESNKETEVESCDRGGSRQD